jgi:hypothetical protein
MIQEDTAQKCLLVGGIKSIARMEMSTYKFSSLVPPPGHAPSSTNRRFIIDDSGQSWLYREDGYFIMHDRDSFEWIYPATKYFPIKYADGILHRDEDKLIYLQSEMPHVVDLNEQNKWPPNPKNEIILVNPPNIHPAYGFDTIWVNSGLPVTKWFLNKNKNRNQFFQNNSFRNFDTDQRISGLYFDAKEYFFPDSTVHLICWGRLYDNTTLIGTSRGMLILPPANNPFTGFASVHARKIKQYQQSIWISGDNGLFQYSGSGTLIKKWSSEKIYSFDFYDDKLYGGTQDGKIIRIDLKTGKLKIVSLSIPDRTIRNLYFTGIAGGQVFVGGTPYLIISDPDLSIFKFHSLKNDQGQMHNDILCGQIRADVHELWLGTITGGLFIYSLGDSLSFKKQIFNNTIASYSLTSNTVLDMVADQDKMYLCLDQYNRLKIIYCSIYSQKKWIA